MPASALGGVLALLGLASGVAVVASQKKESDAAGGEYHVDPHLPEDKVHQVLGAIAAETDPNKLTQMAAQVKAEAPIAAASLEKRAVEVAQKAGITPPPVLASIPGVAAQAPPLDTGIDSATQAAVLQALASEVDAAKLQGFAVSIQEHYPIAAGLLLAKANAIPHGGVVATTVPPPSQSQQVTITVQQPAPHYAPHRTVTPAPNPNVPTAPPPVPQQGPPPTPPVAAVPPVVLAANELVTYLHSHGAPSQSVPAAAFFQHEYNRMTPPPATHLLEDGKYGPMTQAALQTVIAPAVAPPNAFPQPAAAGPKPVPKPKMVDVTTAATTLLVDLQQHGAHQTPTQACSTFQQAYNLHRPAAPLTVDGKYGPLCQTALQSVLNTIGHGQTAPQNAFGPVAHVVPEFVAGAAALLGGAALGAGGMWLAQHYMADGAHKTAGAPMLSSYDRRFIGPDETEMVSGHPSEFIPTTTDVNTAGDAVGYFGRGHWDPHAYQHNPYAAEWMHGETHVPYGWPHEHPYFGEHPESVGLGAPPMPRSMSTFRGGGGLNPILSALHNRNAYGGGAPAMMARPFARPGAFGAPAFGAAPFARPAFRPAPPLAQQPWGGADWRARQAYAQQQYQQQQYQQPAYPPPAYGQQPAYDPNAAAYLPAAQPAADPSAAIAMQQAAQQAQQAAQDAQASLAAMQAQQAQQAAQPSADPNAAQPAPDPNAQPSADPNAAQPAADPNASPTTSGWGHPYDHPAFGHPAYDHPSYGHPYGAPMFGHEYGHEGYPPPGFPPPGFPPGSFPGVWPFGHLHEHHEHAMYAPHPGYAPPPPAPPVVAGHFRGGFGRHGGRGFGHGYGHEWRGRDYRQVDDDPDATPPPLLPPAETAGFFRTGWGGRRARGRRGGWGHRHWQQMMQGAQQAPMQQPSELDAPPEATGLGTVIPSQYPHGYDDNVSGRGGYGGHFGGHGRVIGHYPWGGGNWGEYNYAPGPYAVEEAPGDPYAEQ